MSSLILDLFFLVTLAQGAIRKWVAPGLSLEIEFFRDTLPVLALITCKPHVRRQLGRFSGRAATLLWAYASAAVFAAFSPGLPVFVVLVGIRTHFAYLPLALLMPIYLKSWTHGLRKFRQLLMLAVPILLLGLFQTTQPAGSVWNRYVDPEVAVATFGAGDSARATGTFAYITEFASFAEICAIITVLLILTSESNIVGRLWNAGLLIMALGAMMASGCRGPVAVFGAQVLGIAVLGSGVRAISMRYLLLFVVLMIMAVAVSVTILDRQAANFLLRAQDLGTSDTSERVGAGLFEWLEVMYQYPLGVGLGAGHQAFYAVMLDIGTPDLWEAELSRLAFELGLGVIFYIAFKVTLVGQLLARVKATRTRAGRLTLAMCITTLTPLIVTSSVYEPLTNAAFWAFVGVGFWVVKLKAAALLALPAAAPILERTVPAARTTSPIRVGAQ